MARANLTVPQSYAALRSAVESVVFKGRRDIERAWIHTYHETGRLINEHILLKRDRAGYGAKVFEKLSVDTGISKRTLHECAQFHRCFPIVRAPAQLTRTHYIVLCQVADERRRTALLQETLRNGWSIRQLGERVRALNAAAGLPEPAESTPAVTPPRLLTSKRGTPGVCKVIAVEGASVADLGFATYRDVEAAHFKAGDFVRVQASGRVEAASGATKADLFTYRAAVLKVVDGDTMWVKVYLEPERWVKQKLRLRDLDCPEMDTAGGKAAKRFVEALVAESAAVTVCTTKPDKYDRYLADVFLTTAEGEVYLNNELLKTGHAVRKGDYSPADWGDPA
jgi:micrococcal nuclease